MSLTPEAQALVLRLRSVLGVPACQIVINYRDNGTVQSVEPRVIFRPPTKAEVAMNQEHG